MAIVVPKGSHVIDFRIVPEVFNLGVKVSFMTGFLLLFGYISLRGTSSYFFKRR